ncbi:hypothetical protein DSECCO2_286620 [anaerobic digester metagenome]
MAIFSRSKRKSPVRDLTMGVDLIGEILNRTDQEMADMPPVNIMLIGKTGVGKSTLINEIFRENLADTGIGAPVTPHLLKITKTGVPLTLYDTKGLELSEEAQRMVQHEVVGLLKEKDLAADPKEKIHCVWFCISSLSRRLEKTERIWINALALQLPVIVVLTQALEESGTRELKEYIEQECPQIRACIPVIARDYSIGPHTLPSFGLKELMLTTFRNIPDESQRAFINAQRVDIDKKAELASRWARRFVYETFAVGFIPIPFADAPIIATSQVTMIAKITAIFGISYDRAMLTSLVGAMAGIGGAVVTGRTLTTNLLKLVPGAGTLVTGMISGSTAAAITLTMSRVYISALREVSLREYAGEKVLPDEIRYLVETEMRKYMERSRK